MKNKDIRELSVPELEKTIRDTRDQLMWLDQPCSGFIVIVDSVVVLHDMMMITASWSMIFPKSWEKLPL